MRFEFKSFAMNVLASLVAALLFGPLIYLGGWMLGHARQAAAVAACLPILVLVGCGVAFLRMSLQDAKMLHQRWWRDCRVAEIRGKPMPPEPPRFPDFGTWLFAAMMIGGGVDFGWAVFSSIWWDHSLSDSSLF